MELTALPSIGTERWLPWVQQADVLLADGDETLGVVGFSLFPHLDHPALPENTVADAERWAAALPNPAYAIDDDTAVKVTDGAVEIVSEGHRRLF
ncbi:hypothetical protein ACWERV_32500 [Streptomyces sp. NPDC004031]